MMLDVLDMTHPPGPRKDRIPSRPTNSMADRWGALPDAPAVLAQTKRGVTQMAQADDNISPFPTPAKTPTKPKSSRSSAAKRARRYRARKRHALVLAERHAPPSTNADVAPLSFDSVTPSTVTLMAPDSHAPASRSYGRMGAILIIISLAIAVLAIGINAQV
jgi:hypothetical protein